MATQRIFKQLGLEPAKAEGTAMVFRCSDFAPDRVGDRVLVAGMQLGNFERNPVLLWQHDQLAPPIGTAKCWVEGEGAQAVLYMSPTFSSVNPLAQQLKAQVEAGEIRAVSIGFLSEEPQPNQLGGLDHVSTELTEVSLVTVPCHPGATREKSMNPEEMKQCLEMLQALDAKLETALTQIAALKPETPADAEPAEKSAAEEPAESAEPALETPTDSPEEEQEKSFFALFQ